MVTINPAMVIGPLLQPTLNATVELILNFINGGQTFPNQSYGWVNVRDVADAHIRAYEILSARGRHILAERVAHYSEITKILRELYPAFQVAHKQVLFPYDELFMPTYQVSNEKAKSLGIEYIPLEDQSGNAVDFERIVAGCAEVVA
ncbi:hypothetical protein TIFTF001_001240 [Ficus carica]|uniref:Uncharacterized protein n=1 Tax=Ficus carica TaxID=3494 RepID=A0AA88D449_FICCA|nr:hypothetical protein TIFTF001_001240 [Ficus carica]